MYVGMPFTSLPRHAVSFCSATMLHVLLFLHEHVFFFLCVGVCLPGCLVWCACPAYVSVGYTLTTIYYPVQGFFFLLWLVLYLSLKERIISSADKTFMVA